MGAEQGGGEDEYIVESWGWEGGKGRMFVERRKQEEECWVRACPSLGSDRREGGKGKGVTK